MKPIRRARTIFLVSVLCLTSTCLAYTISPSTVASASTTQGQLESVVLNQHVSRTGLPYTNEGLPSWPNIVSHAAVVMDMTTGTIVYAKAPLAPHYPASLTKIMTAMLALQHGRLTDELTATQQAVDQPPDKLYLEPGEREPLASLLTAMMVNSDNDVALEVAQHYAGNPEHFATWMNEEAVSLGAVHTHFVNPSGLPAKSQVTTAYDLALITKAAMQDPNFRKMVATREVTWRGQAWSAKLTNLNSMLFTYSGAIGVKTGWTTQANETLAVAATRRGTTFLVILLDARLASEINADATALLNYAFAHYRTQTLMPSGALLGSLKDAKHRVIPVRTTEPVLATVEISQRAKPSIQLHVLAPHRNQPEGSVIGYAVVKWHGEKQNVPVALGRTWEVANQTTAGTKRFPPLKRLLWGVFAALLFAFISRGMARKVARRRRAARWR